MNDLIVRQKERDEHLMEPVCISVKNSIAFDENHKSKDLHSIYFVE